MANIIKKALICFSDTVQKQAEKKVMRLKRLCITYFYYVHFTKQMYSEITIKMILTSQFFKWIAQKTYCLSLSDESFI